MDYDYSDLVANTKRWAERAVAAGWIDQHMARQLEALDSRTPEALIDRSTSRPLIVAFMGGTGVGKSTLLNRLAGQPIARTGIERPTSREVTMYRHRAVQLSKLPENLPFDEIRQAEHDDETNKNVIWIDMPDFDSTALHNQEIVLQWLPHIDVLIYVVSPERYRDNKAWRLLLAEGGRHAWLFVMNQWDRGEAVQYDDFKEQLSVAGFDVPIIFKTSCGELDFSDEFENLAETIAALATETTVKQLESRNTQARKDALKMSLANCLKQVGNDRDYRELSERWRRSWQETGRTLQQGFEWPLRQLAGYYAEHEKASKHQQSELWDAWAQSRFEDTLDDLILHADAKGLATAALKREVLQLRGKAEKIMHDQTELAVRQALANPGHAAHRAFLKSMRFCEIVLPLGAMSFVGYQVFSGYYHSSLDYRNYLGANFAIHSGLFVGLSWLIPFFILKKLKPSLEKAALKGLKKGAAIGLIQIEAEIVNAIERLCQQRNEIAAEAEQIIRQCESSQESIETIRSDSRLARMLVD